MRFHKWSIFYETICDAVLKNILGLKSYYINYSPQVVLNSVSSSVSSSLSPRSIIVSFVDGFITTI